MERRELLKGAGILAMSALLQPAFAADEHHHHHDVAPKKSAALLAAASDCIVKGDACLAHCLVLLGEGEKEMAACAQSVNQMLAICTALQKLASQESSYLPALAKLAGDVCKDCEKACRKHEKKHAECKACADACAECLKQCKALAA
jgi:Cys-rich four helix bundle protein (predicted Tat secretion target)